MKISTTGKYPTGTPIAFRIMAAPTLRRAMRVIERIQQPQKLSSDGSAIVSTEKLSSDLLTDLFENRVLAIHLRNFCPENVCDLISENALQYELTALPIVDAEKGLKEVDVETIDSRNYDSRSFSFPFSCPLDRVRLLLDEQWGSGLMSRTYKNEDDRSGVGRFRVMHDTVQPKGIPLNCHIDSLPIMNAHRGIFSINIYLRPPVNGGELYIWNPKISVFKHFAIVYNFVFGSNYMNEKQQRHYQGLFPDPHVVEIQKGDLVIINTGRPHAIAPMQGGPRVTLQAFLQYRRKKPLEIS